MATYGRAVRAEHQLRRTRHIEQTVECYFCMRPVKLSEVRRVAIWSKQLECGTWVERENCCPECW